MTETPAPVPAGPASNPPTPGNAGDTPPPRRGRGRPFGSRTRTPPLTEQAVPAVDGAPPAPQDSPAPRRRRSKAIDKEALANQLVGLHEIAAQVTGIGIARITPKEGAMLADAIESVAREYDLALDGKTGAFIQLLFAAGCIYGPRVLMFQAAKRRAASAPGPVEAPGPALNGTHAAA